MKRMKLLVTVAVLAALYGGALVRGQGATVQQPALIYGVDTATGLTHPIKVASTGALDISASISGADGSIQDGANAAIEATVFDLTSSNPLATQIVDANGAAITSFGGGVQYTEGDTDASITGTAILAEGAGNTLIAVPGTVANGLLVNVSAVAGTVTVAGNLTNISGTISLPTGAATSANQSTEITALQLIDNLPNTQGSTTSGQSGLLAMGAVTTSAPSYTNAQTSPISLQTDGSVRVAITNGGGGGTSAVDDADFTDSSTVFTLAGCVAESASPSTVTEGDMGACAMTLNRAVKVTLYTAAGDALTPSSDATYSEAVVTTGPQGMSEAKDQDGSALPNSVTEGEAVRNAASLNGVQYVMCVNEDGSALCSTIISSGTITTVSTVTSLSQFAGNAIALNAGAASAGTIRMVIATDDPVNDFAVKGDANMVAHDAADAGNPLKVGYKATTSISGLTPVATNDRTDAFAGIDGIAIFRPHSNLEDRVSAVVGVTDGSSTQLIPVQGSGIRFCATTIILANSSATNVTVDLRDGTAGSVLATIPAAANSGGAVVSLQTPLCTTANTIFAMDPSASASTITATAIGFKTKL